MLVPNMTCRRAYAVDVRRSARRIRGKGAATLGHHAHAAEGENFGLDRDLLANGGNLRNRQYAGEDDPLHAKSIPKKANRGRVGRRGLDGEVPTHGGIALRRVIEQANIGEDKGVRPHRRRVVDGAMPGSEMTGCGERVYGDIDFRATRMRIVNAFLQLWSGEVE